MEEEIEGTSKFFESLQEYVNEQQNKGANGKWTEIHKLENQLDEARAARKLKTENFKNAIEKEDSNLTIKYVKLKERHDNAQTEVQTLKVELENLKINISKEKEQLAKDIENNLKAEEERWRIKLQEIQDKIATRKQEHREKVEKLNNDLALAEAATALEQDELEVKLRKELVDLNGGIWYQRNKNTQLLVEIEALKKRQQISARPQNYANPIEDINFFQLEQLDDLFQQTLTDNTSIQNQPKITHTSSTNPSQLNPRHTPDPYRVSDTNTSTNQPKTTSNQNGSNRGSTYAYSQNDQFQRTSTNPQNQRKTNQSSTYIPQLNPQHSSGSHRFNTTHTITSSTYDPSFNYNNQVQTTVTPAPTNTLLQLQNQQKTNYSSTYLPQFNPPPHTMGSYSYNSPAPADNPPLQLPQFNLQHTSASYNYKNQAQTPSTNLPRHDNDQLSKYQPLQISRYPLKTSNSAGEDMQDSGSKDDTTCIELFPSTMCFQRPKNQSTNKIHQPQMFTTSKRGKGRLKIGVREESKKPQLVRNGSVEFVEIVIKKEHSKGGDKKGESSGKLYKNPMFGLHRPVADSGSRQPTRPKRRKLFGASNLDYLDNLKVDDDKA